MKKILKILLVLVFIAVMVAMCVQSSTGPKNYRYNGVEDVYD